ncbi:MAG: hypothetical protein VB934_07890 [Polyangiaceae bacterium]
MHRFALIAFLLLLTGVVAAQEGPPYPPPSPAPVPPPPPAPLPPPPAQPPPAQPPPPAGPPTAAPPAPYPPYPPYGQAPPGYAPAPVPPGPHSPFKTKGPATIDYKDGDRIPPGYRLTTRSRKNVAAIGGAVFLLGYVPSIYLATIASATSSDNFDPLFVPAVGPFITVVTADASFAGGFWLSMLGVAQTGGLVTGIVGLFLPDKKLLRRIGSSPHAPTLSFTPGGAVVHGTF